LERYIVFQVPISLMDPPLLLPHLGLQLVQPGADLLEQLVRAPYPHIQISILQEFPLSVQLGRVNLMPQLDYPLVLHDYLLVHLPYLLRHLRLDLVAHVQHVLQQLHIVLLLLRELILHLHEVVLYLLDVILHLVSVLVDYVDVVVQALVQHPDRLVQPAHLLVLVQEIFIVALEASLRHLEVLDGRPAIVDGLADISELVLDEVGLRDVGEEEVVDLRADPTLEVVPVTLGQVRLLDHRIHRQFVPVGRVVPLARLLLPLEG